MSEASVGNERVCILDYGSGNVRSVWNLLDAIAPGAEVSNDPDIIRASTHLILPGVGAFGAAMTRIRQRIPLDVVEDVVLNQHRPFLGICVGFQVLAEKGFEFGEHEGLGWLPGSVTRLECGDSPLPHIGWNSADIVNTSVLFDGIGPQEDFYFVHSYAVRLADPAHVNATTEYGESFVSVGFRENVYGVQFHPEKSQRAGRRLIQNFLSIR